MRDKSGLILVIFLSFTVCQAVDEGKSRFQIPSSTEFKCQNEFPLKETVNLLKKIVDKYGERRNERDVDGNEWTSMLIDQSKEIKVDGREFRLNSPEKVETTFFLEILELLDEEIFVVPGHTKALWSARHPDRTFLLHKISFDCGKDEVACGLQCCSCRTRSIQNDFLEEIAEKRKRFRRSPTRVISRKYFNDYQITQNGITYSLEPKSGMNCRYRLSQFDDLYKRRNVYNIRTDTIFYKCPPGHGCCSLGCVLISKTLEISQPPSVEYMLDRPRQALVFAQTFFNENSLYIYALLIFLVAFLFIIILVVHIKKIKSMNTNSQKLARNLRHKTTETQTSMASLLLLDSTQSTIRLIPPSSFSIQMRDDQSFLELGSHPSKSPHKRPHSSIVDYQIQPKFKFLSSPTDQPYSSPTFDYYSHTWNPKKSYDSSNPYQSTTLPRNVSTFKPLNTSPLKGI
ncbi:unnamed protein product, partial [Mesorhabditis belari]|uniref:CX domain-containing protein n=1 Tax=Mesorhabditis belari TaxID=2138241 RepID=A0AAF3FBY9_9BILA